MTQRRGLGRGLGALIPGAGATAPRGSDQDPELRTRRTVEPEESGPAAPAATGPRPVDMFFSGDPLPESAESRSRRLAGGTDLAGAMARAAAERRAATRTPARRRAAEATSTDKPAEESAEEASQPDVTPRGSRRTSSSRSTASTSRSGRSGSAKTSSRSSKSEAATASSGTSSTSTSGSVTSGGQKKSASAKTGSRKPTAAKTGSEKAASGKAASRKPAAKTPSEKITDAPAPSSDPAPAESSSVEPSPVEVAPVAVTPSPDASAVAPASGPPEDRVEDSPIVDVEKVELTPAHPDRVAPAQPAAEQASKEVARESPAQTAADPEDLPVPPSAEPQEAESASDPAEAGMQDANREPSPSGEQVPDAAGAAAEDLDGLVRVPGAEFAEIPIHEIRENPRNPRTMFDDDALDELAFSLREVGVLQPVVVRSIPVTEDGESFELVMGERRWRAAQRAGLTSIPAIIRETSDDDLLRDALLENLHRTQLNPLEEAAAYQQLLDDFGCTQDELSARIGRSRPQISNTLRLMRLPALVQRRLASGALSAGHARALLTLEDPRLMEELAGRIVAEGLSVRAVERLVARGPESTGAKPAAPRRTTYNPRVVDITSRLSNRLEAPVRIDVGKRKGRITLEFTNLDDLERLVERLGIEQAEEHAGSVD